MKNTCMSALIVALVSSLPAFETHAATFIYGGVEIIPGSDVDQRFETARSVCTNEAATPTRGTPSPDSFYYRAAMRSCLYRQGFFGDGSYVYPVPLYGRPSYRD
jgi:hypothetical protein